MTFSMRNNVIIIRQKHRPRYRIDKEGDPFYLMKQVEKSKTATGNRWQK